MSTVKKKPGSRPPKKAEPLKKGAALSKLASGRRSQQKLDKHERIKQAALSLFVSEGYEKTTTKAVAQLAEIAAGTLFLYAKDKPDLLFLVMHDRLSQAVARGFDTLPQTSHILNQWLHLFREVYLMYEEHPALGKAFVRALPGADGPNAQKVNALTFGFLHQLASLVVQAQGRGEISTEVEPLQVASNVFALYFSGLMAWLQEFVTLDQVLDPLLKNALALQIRGLKP
jgi:AcrR family transcriptional regulator